MLTENVFVTDKLIDELDGNQILWTWLIKNAFNVCEGEKCKEMNMSEQYRCSYIHWLAEMFPISLWKAGSLFSMNRKNLIHV